MQIHKLYEQLANLKQQSDGISAPPSQQLSKVLAPEFRVRGVGLRMQTNCAGAPVPPKGEEGPELRNAIEQLSIKQGDVFRFKIPEDTFRSAKGGNTRELELSVLTIDGHSLPRSGPLYFNEDMHEIHAMALEPADLHETQVRRARLRQ